MVGAVELGVGAVRVSGGLWERVESRSEARNAVNASAALPSFFRTTFRPPRFVAPKMSR